jgi:hypothetical protein
VAVVLVALSAGVLGGCSADLAMIKDDWNWWKSTPPTSSAPLSRASAPADALASADGNCAPAAQPPAGIAVGMTECDVVHVAGPTTQIQISTNERGERSVVMTYPEGDHAGIYRFTSGILASVDEVPAPPKPAKPVRRAPAKKRPPPKPAPQAAATPMPAR